MPAGSVGFSRECYKEILINSLKYCQEHKGLKLHARVIMTNHVHLIVSTETNKIKWLVRDIKKYSSKQILAAIQENAIESRKEWMLNMFSYAGKRYLDFVIECASKGPLLKLHKARNPNAVVVRPRQRPKQMN